MDGGNRSSHGQLWWLNRSRTAQDRSRPVGVILGGLAGTIWFKQNKHLGRIVQVLRETLPAELADHLAVDGFRRNTLHLRVDSAVHRYELEMIKELLLTELNQQVSGVFIREIKLSLGRLDQPWIATPPGPGRPSGAAD